MRLYFKRKKDHTELSRKVKMFIVCFIVTTVLTNGVTIGQGYMAAEARPQKQRPHRELIYCRRPTQISPHKRKPTLGPSVYCFF